LYKQELAYLLRTLEANIGVIVFQKIKERAFLALKRHLVEPIREMFRDLYV
jgi:hypothetical protein